MDFGFIVIPILIVCEHKSWTTLSENPESLEGLVFQKQEEEEVLCCIFRRKGGWQASPQSLGKLPSLYSSEPFQGKRGLTASLKDVVWGPLVTWGLLTPHTEAGRLSSLPHGRAEWVPGRSQGPGHYSLCWELQERNCLWAQRVQGAKLPPVCGKW